MTPKVKVQKSDNKVVSAGYCDFTAELGTDFEQFDVTELEMQDISKDMGTVELKTITRNADGTFTTT